MAENSRRSPLGKARNHGSANTGTGHWIHQRISAIALIILGPWFLYSVLTEDMMTYQGVMEWLDNPGDVIFLILTIVVALYHGALGLQVVIEDYIHSNWMKFPMLVITKFTFVLLGAMAIYAVVSAKFFVNSHDLSYYGEDDTQMQNHIQNTRPSTITEAL